jgi:hypothetical protein
VPVVLDDCCIAAVCTTALVLSKAICTASVEPEVYSQSWFG